MKFDISGFAATDAVLEATQTGGAICACGFTVVIDRNEADVFALSGTGVARGNSREWPTKDKAETGGAVGGIAGMVWQVAVQ